MSAAAGGNERDHPKRLAVDHVDAVAHHVGDEEDAAVRRESHVLRHRMAGELQPPSTFCSSTSTFTISPENSQLATR